MVASLHLRPQTDRFHQFGLTTPISYYLGVQAGTPETPSPPFQLHLNRIQVDDLLIATEDVMPIQVNVAAASRLWH
jgi:hypothetical protein